MNILYKSFGMSEWKPLDKVLPFVVYACCDGTKCRAWNAFCEAKGIDAKADNVDAIDSNRYDEWIDWLMEDDRFGNYPEMMSAMKYRIVN